MSIFPQVAMNEISVVFGTLEGDGIGINFDNVTETVSNYTYVIGIVMLIISGIFFSILGLYLDAILPKKYGERKKCCFCFTMCCKKTVDPEDRVSKKFESNDEAAA